MSRWEDLTELEQLAVLYSDAHKDAYGFRPRDGGLHNPQTVEDYRAAIDDCSATIVLELEREEERAKEEAAAFEAEIATLMGDHGIDRATALRWWFAAEGFTGDCRQDAEHVLWKRHMPYRLWEPILSEFMPRPLAA